MRPRLNTQLRAHGWVGVYKLCSGSLAWCAVSGWWSTVRQGWNGTAPPAQSGQFRSAPNVQTNFNLPRNPDKTAVRRNARKLCPATQAQADRCRKGKILVQYVLRQPQAAVGREQVLHAKVLPYSNPHLSQANEFHTHHH